MDIHRESWNRQQQILKAALSDPAEHPEWLELFLIQHAQVHSSNLAQEEWSFEDEVLMGLDEDSLRRIPGGGEHSIAWILYHLARIEDVTMNMLVADDSQIASEEGWLDKMHVPIMHTGNASFVEEVARLSYQIDMDVLRAYRLQVGRRTRQVVSQLTPDKLSQWVEPARIEKVRTSGAILAAAGEIVDYWSRRTLAGLLLMPPTRHCYLHLNEALRIRQALKA